MIRFLLYTAISCIALVFGGATKLVVLNQLDEGHLVFESRKYDNDDRMFHMADQVDQILLEEYNGEARCFALKNPGEPRLFIIDKNGFLIVRRSVIKRIDSIFSSKGIHAIPGHPFPRIQNINLH